MTANKSSIHLIMFYMQSKEMFKLTPQLCRLAKAEFHDRKALLPHDVREDDSFVKILVLIEHIENSEYAKATEILNDAFNEHEEMMSYFPKSRVKPVPQKDQTKVQENDIPEEPVSIFDENWEPPKMRPESIPTPQNVQALAEQNSYTRRVLEEKEEFSGRKLGTTSPKEYVHKYDDTDINKSFKEELVEKINYKTILRPRNGNLQYERIYVAHSPAVLADRFSDLYKLEWKAAYEELTVTLGDKQTVRHLLWIIAKASIICASLATHQLQDLENSSVGIMVSRDPLNKKVLVEEPLNAKQEKTVARAREMLIEYRRELSSLSIPILQKEIRQAIASELSTSLPRRYTGIGNHFVEYANNCIEIIWYMYVHDPPMHLEWLTKEQEGTQFRTEQYEMYTSKGTLFDYCVWPVVRLHKSGPVLKKGIAQAK